MSAGARWHIVPASAAIQHLPTLAAWHHAEWGALYAGWSEDDAFAELQAHAACEVVLPSTWVALGEDGAPLGSVSLLVEDAPDLAALGGPWLASLYVGPVFRGRGLGEALVHHAVRRAFAAGIPRLRLFTPHHRAFYERLGWSFEAGARVGGQAVDVLTRVP
ncbi:GNAT family N-acetyltransferase [Silanimonas algicola]